MDNVLAKWARNGSKNKFKVEKIGSKNRFKGAKWEKSWKKIRKQKKI